MKILIMGLPGSGKTYLTERLQPFLRQLGITQIKLEKWQMIGIFLMMVEEDNQ